jgi:hypothetical protein
LSDEKAFAFRRQWSNIIHRVDCESARLKAELQTLSSMANEKWNMANGK